MIFNTLIIFQKFWKNIQMFSKTFIFYKPLIRGIKNLVQLIFSKIWMKARTTITTKFVWRIRVVHRCFIKQIKFMEIVWKVDKWTDLIFLKKMVKNQQAHNILENSCFRDLLQMNVFFFVPLKKLQRICFLLWMLVKITILQLVKWLQLKNK